MLELAFAAYLVFILPGQSLYKSLQPKPAPDPARKARRMARFIAHVAVLLAALAALMVLNARTPAQIGLDWPLQPAGQWGLVASGVLIVGLWVGQLVWERRTAPEKLADFRAKMREADMAPENGAQLRRTAGTMVFVSVAWELLYRGFLMLVLPPVTGTAGAVVLAAVSYGVAHGYQSRGQFIGSIVSAFLFTLAYVATDSLWWLMVVHASLPLFGVLSAYRHRNAPAAVQGAYVDSGAKS